MELEDVEAQVFEEGRREEEEPQVAGYWPERRCDMVTNEAKDQVRS